MRKLFALAAFCLLISSVYSCKSREKCPAYGHQPVAKSIPSSEG